MKKFLKTSLLLATLLLGLTACSVQTETTTEKLTSNSAGNNKRIQGEYKVNEKELTFKSNGNTIYGRVLLPETNHAVPTVIEPWLWW